MSKIGIIYIGDAKATDGKLCHGQLDFGCGGTETCIIQLAEQFASDGNEVHVMCTCDDHEELGVIYDSADKLDNVLKSNKFDFIIVECYYKSIVKKIEKHQSTQCILLFHSLNGFNQHDCYDMSSGFRLSNYLTDSELQSPLIKKFIAISESQKNEYIAYNGIPDHMIAVIPNGIDARMFESVDIDHEVDHSVLWSSSYFRGAKMLIDGVAPVVRQQIHDFSVDLCTPSYCKDAFTHSCQANFIGHLSKADLYEQMKKHACWWYPSTFNETFCITSVEAALCGNELILPLKNGPATTFKPFAAVISTQNDASKVRDLIIESAMRICTSICHYHDSERVEMRKKIRDYLIETCSWSKVADMFMEAANEL